jgi:hypothetical protein
MHLLATQQPGQLSPQVSAQVPFAVSQCCPEVHLSQVLQLAPAAPQKPCERMSYLQVPLLQQPAQFEGLQLPEPSPLPQADTRVIEANRVPSASHRSMFVTPADRCLPDYHRPDRSNRSEERFPPPGDLD